MGCYSREVLTTLILMILTGAGRTLAVKVYFQLGFDDPFLVAILVLLGRSLAVPIYWLVEWLVPATDADAEGADGDKPKELKETYNGRMTDLEKAAETRACIVPDTDVDVDVDVDVDENKAADETEMSHSEPADLEMKDEAVAIANALKQEPVSATPFNPVMRRLSSPTIRRLSKTLRDVVHTEWKHDGTLMTTDDEESQVIEQPNEKSIQTRDTSSLDEDSAAEGETAEISQRITRSRQRKSNRGSVHGMSEKSREAVQWVHKIPNWAKPLMSSGFNLLDVAFRIISILYLPAVVAEMLVGGTKLILSMVIARVVRKMPIARQKWCGAGIMVVGLVLVACSDFVSDNESSESFGLGVLFVMLKVIMGVSKDMVQELFIQESDYSATLLLGMESVYGLLMAVPLYFLLGPVAGYDPVEAFRGIGESSLSIGYTFGLLLIFFVTGMYSILSMAATSAMTNNMWKNFRGLVVWIAALIIFYASGDEDLGEPFSIPGSFMILAGFPIMLSALYVYYTE
jgi:drug/metabolite transporter (DMT)-like permease